MLGLITAIINFFNVHTGIVAILLVLAIALVAGPWVMLVLYIRDSDKKLEAFKGLVTAYQAASDKNLAEVRQMYIDNQAAWKRTLDLAEEHAETVIRNTEAWAEVKAKVEDCPRGGLPK